MRNKKHDSKEILHKNKKAGLAPGSVIYTGHHTNETPITIDHYSYNENEHNTHMNTKLNNIILSKDKTDWICIDGVHDTNLIKEIGHKFKIDDIILEDIANVHQRPKLEERDNFVYIVLRMLDYNEEEIIQSEQLSLIVSNDFLISFSEDKGDVFNSIRTRIENGSRIRRKSHDYLAYCILDAIVDNYLFVLDKIEFKLDTLETKLLKESDKNDLENIMILKDEFISIKKAMNPLRDLTSRIEHSEFVNIFKPDLQIYIKDLHDHAIIVHETLETLSNRISGLFSIYHSTINNTMNERMKVLTIVSTLFAPLTFIVGVYGMNYKYMPELEWKLGYLGVWVTILCTAAAMIYFFKKKKWF